MTRNRILTLAVGVALWGGAVVLAIYDQTFLTPVKEALYALGTGFIILFILRRYLDKNAQSR
jgi:hypothetical protein